MQTVQLAGPATLASHPARNSLQTPRRATLFAQGSGRRDRRSLVVQAEQKTEEEQKKIESIEASLKQSGINKDNAKRVLSAWKKAVGTDEDITPDMLRKVLLKQSAKTTGLILIQVLLDLGAAYGAQTVGNLAGGASPQYGLPAVILQGLAYFVSGWYYVGAVFDALKVGAVVIAAQSFNVNSGAFLAAVQDLAKDSTGLSAVDKVQEAVNTFKVLQALGKMNDLLKAESQSKTEGGGSDLLGDLGAYLVLEKAQRSFGFDANKFGISDTEAAQIAATFASVDTNDDGVLNYDEFRRLCNKYALGLNDAEMKAALALLDKNQDGIIQFNEFVSWWLKKPDSATAST